MPHMVPTMPKVLQLCLCVQTWTSTTIQWHLVLKSPINLMICFQEALLIVVIGCYALSLLASIVRLSPLHQALQDSINFEIGERDLASSVGGCGYEVFLPPVCGDQSLPILRLLKALYALNVHWTDLYPVSLTLSPSILLCFLSSLLNSLVFNPPSSTISSHHIPHLTLLPPQSPHIPH